jgi:hypothetical protein
MNPRSKTAAEPETQAKRQPEENRGNDQKPEIASKVVYPFDQYPLRPQ